MERKDHHLFFQLIMTTLLLVAGANGYAQETAYSDGPYVFVEKKRLVLKRMVEGEVEKEKLELNTYPTTFETEPSIFTGVDRIAALSDIHGQFDLAIEILQNNGIIDEEQKWAFEDGHLVIVGDIFDRGPKVTEMLWFVFELEKQAKSAGGKVHFLLGNHEYMVLRGDLRYLHPKYVQAEEELKTSYDELYGPETVLGRWLRSKSTVLKINEDIYVHGGISRNFIDSVDWNLQQINNEMRASIDKPYEELDSIGFYQKFYGSDGPIWYRGYFLGDLPQSHVDELLEDMEANHVIVGHCSVKEVVSLHNNRIFGVDSSIKLGKYGEVLFVMKDEYSRGTKDGEVIPFKMTPD